MVYSIIIPCYNSDKTIRKVVELIINEFERMDRGECEIILVNDCSPDGNKTLYEIEKLVLEYENIIGIDLAKNSGQHNAVMAGLNYATGDAFIAMDDDLQTHPSQLEKLIDKFEEGHDVVYGYYPQKKHNPLRNLGSYVNYLTVRVLVGKPKDLKTSSFWIIKKFVRDYVIQYDSSYTYLQGLFLRTTKDIVCIPIQHFERAVGTSNYTFKKLVELWSNVLGFSVVPLRIASGLGYFFSVVGLLGAVIIVVKKLLHPAITLGWPSMMIGICFFSGLNLLFMGLIGEYIGRMFLEINKQPQYVVKRIYGKEENVDE